ncbi:MAG: SUMF1/EgtB/PvdO family nonheme iron enzyme, partial [Oscillospiraceae bacterium]|nr:SUMF1/EgtB/PvdO family nonheme iron enzyme [Oscillospiraceae bacterium]
MKRKGKNPEKGRVLEVCSKGASRYDLCDMMGNAEEWVADWYT